MMTPPGKTAFAARALGATIWLLALAMLPGCALFHSTVSEKSWTQTAEHEEQEQQHSAAPQGNASAMPW